METAEHRVVDPKCLPFSSIPHTTRLFDDFLHHFDKVRRFYARPPLAGNWWQEEQKGIAYPDERPKAVPAILERQHPLLRPTHQTRRHLPPLPHPPPPPLPP